MDFDAILIKWTGAFIKFFYDKSGDFELSKDLYQDLFIKVRSESERRELKFADEKVFVAWAYKIANSVLVDYYRAKKRDGVSEEFVQDEFRYFDYYADTEPTREDEIIQEEELERVKLAVSKLRPEQREVFEMKVLEGVKFRDMVKITGRGLNTLLGQMRYARINLKKNLYPCN